MMAGAKAAKDSAAMPKKMANASTKKGEERKTARKAYEKKPKA
jgi:hypothetical protein